MLKLDLSHVDERFWSSGRGDRVSGGTLVIRDRVVQWRNESNNSLIKQYTCECIPLAAVLFPFQHHYYSDDPVVVILLSSSLLRLHTIEGQTFELGLNFIAKNIYPSSLGLLVERECLSLSRQLYSPHDSKHLLYSVTSPNGPIRPVHSEGTPSSSCEQHSDGQRQRHTHTHTLHRQGESFSEQMEHDFKCVVSIWDRYVCVYDAESRSLALHSLRVMDTAVGLVPSGRGVESVGPNISGMMGERGTPGSFVSSHSSDSANSYSVNDRSLPVNHSDFNGSDHSVLSAGSNSTGYSSLRRRPKKQARSDVKPSRRSIGLVSEFQSQVVSPRSTSPTSFCHLFQQQSHSQQSQVEISQSLHDDVLNNSHSNIGDDAQNTTQASMYMHGDEDHLPPELQLDPPLATVQLNTLTDWDEGSTGGNSDRLNDFPTHFDVSFSLSPMGTILVHLLSLRNDILHSYAFFPDIGDPHKHQAPGSSRLKLMCVRKSVKSLAHVYLGKQKRFRLGSCDLMSEFSKKVDSHLGTSVMINSPGFANNSTMEMGTGDSRDAGNGDDADFLLSCHEAALNNDFNDLIGTLLLLTTGECDLVIGVSPPIAKVDLVASLSNNPFTKFLDGNDDELINKGVHSGLAEGYFLHSYNCFQDCRNQKGELTFKKFPQCRPNVQLLLKQSSEAGSDQLLSQLYNLSLPLGSFLRGHVDALEPLPTQNSEILDSPPRHFHSVFSSLCNSMLLLLRKLSFIRELELLEESCSSNSDICDNRSSLLEPVTATLNFLLALENKVGFENAGAIGIPILLTVVSAAESTLSCENILTIAQLQVVCGTCSETDISHCNNIFAEQLTFLEELVAAYYKVVRESFTRNFLLVIFEVLHMILEDQHLIGLSPAHSDIFQRHHEAREPDVSAAAKSVTVSMLCVSAQWGKDNPFSRYYTSMVRSMRVNATMVDKALVEFTSSGCKTGPYDFGDERVPSAHQWLQGALHFLSDSRKVHSFSSPFASIVTRIAETASGHSFCRTSCRKLNGSIDLTGGEDRQFGCSPSLTVCGSVMNGSQADRGQVNSLCLLMCIEVSQIVMPRLAVLKSFLMDLSLRLENYDDLNMQRDEHVYQCLVGAFLKCCKFAADNFDECKGQAVLRMFPLSLKLAIEHALFHTRHNLLPAMVSTNSAKYESGYSTQIHTCLFCPLNVGGCYCFIATHDLATSDRCKCYAANPSCFCTGVPTSINSAGTVSLNWPVDILQLVGREDFIANSMFSSYSTYRMFSLMNPSTESSEHSKSSHNGNLQRDSSSLKTSRDIKQERDADDLLFTSFPHLMQLNQRDFEETGMVGQEVNDFSSGALSADSIKASGGSKMNGKVGGQQAMGGFGGDVDGLKNVDLLSISRFAEDERMKEVCRLLRSSKTHLLKVERSPEATDVSHRYKQQLRLLSICRRSLALSVGRGMLTLSSLDPLMAEHLPIPLLSLAGRVPPTNAVIGLDTASAPPELTMWPEFHNGVAAGLRVRGGRQGLVDSSSGQGRGKGHKFAQNPSRVSPGPGAVTRNWILYNRNNSSKPQSTRTDADDNDTMSRAAMDNAHAGSLLAFGLLGHLSVLNKSDITDYLTKNHEPTSIAMLIGLAASKIGTADALVSRTLYIHHPSLLFPTTSSGASLNYATYQVQGQGGNLAHIVSPLIQTAALIGLGLLHCNTGHRLMVEFLIADLITGASSSTEQVYKHPEARESIALAAGWSLGMVLLCRGKDKKSVQPVTTNPAHSTPGQGVPFSSTLVDDDVSSPLSDLRLEDRLQQCIEGGRRDSLYESKLFNNPRVESHSTLAASRARNPAQQSGDDPSSRSSRSLETDFININITAPGAIMALTLMYMKSNNNDLASRMAVPATLFALDNIRPDLLIFRAMSTCLIMWDEGVSPTTAWMREKLPPLLLHGLFMEPLRVAEGKVEAAAVLEARLNEEEGRATQISNIMTFHHDDDDNDELDEDSFDPLLSNTQYFPDATPVSLNPEANTSGRIGSVYNNQQATMSMRSSFQALICILAGNAWGLALRYAGTSDSEAKKILLGQLRFFQCLRDGVVPPLEVVDFLCADDHAYLKLQSLVKRAGVDGKDPTPGQVKKVYNPIFQAFLQTAGDKASKPILETCVTLIALSTAVVLAGSGDLDTLTILRILRSKIDETTYGTHMGIGMAIGFLFLGQGRASLRRDPLSLGALLISMTPRFPSRTPDNQNHLQALRHLYVLAMEERCLTTLDVDQEQSVSIDVQVTMRSGKSLLLKSPTLLPELSTVASITACSKDYFGASIEFSESLCRRCNPAIGTQRDGSSRSHTCPSTVRMHYVSSTLHDGQTANLQRMKRCSRCPNATILYVKKRDASATNRESDIFRNIDDHKDNAKALSNVQRLDTTALGSVSLASATSWIRDRMSLSNRHVADSKVVRYFANRNPLMFESLIQRQVALDGSQLHSLMSRSSASACWTTTSHYSSQPPDETSPSFGSSVELSLLRIWCRKFPMFSCPPVHDGLSQQVAFSKILSVGEETVHAKLVWVSSIASSSGEKRNLVDLFALFLTNGSVVEHEGLHSTPPTMMAMGKIDNIFTSILISWGIPIEFRLPSTANEQKHVASYIQNLTAQSLHEDLSISTLVSHVDSICMHIVTESLRV